MPRTLMGRSAPTPTRRLSQVDRRPWGEFTVIGRWPMITVKTIKVNPLSRLSLQKHRLRDEEWVCVSGIGVAQVGTKRRRLRVGSRVFIPRRTLHRLSTSKGVEILEVSYGIFKEDDVVRVDDDYGRADRKDVRGAAPASNRGRG